MQPPAMLGATVGIKVKDPLDYLAEGRIGLGGVICA